MDVNKIKEIFNKEEIADPFVVIDVGANIGQFYEEWKHIFHDSLVISVEANTECMTELHRRNPNSYNMLLLDKNKTDVPYYNTLQNPRSTGNSIYRETTRFFSDDLIQEVHLQSHTLDYFLESKPLKFSTSYEGVLPIGLIKIDVQGSELDVLKGGLKTIQRVDMLLLELPYNDHVYNEGAPTREDVLDWLKENWGEYQTHSIDFNKHPISGEVIQEDVLFIRTK